MSKTSDLDGRLREIEARLDILEGKHIPVQLMKVVPGMVAYWVNLTKDIGDFPVPEGLRDGDIVEFVESVGAGWIKVRNRLFPHDTAVVSSSFLERINQ